MNKFKKYRILALAVVLAFGIWGVYEYNLHLESEKNRPEPADQKLSAPKDKGDESLDLSRKEIMNYVSEHLDDLSPEEPVLGGEWHAIRFWFSKKSNANFYVEYEDGHILRQMLINVDKGDGGRYRYNVVAFFEPGENGWVLKDGKDALFGEELVLVEVGN